VKSSGRSDGFGSRVESLIEQDCAGLALIHLNSYLESAIVEDIEADEAGHLEWYSADIDYDRALERARNQQLDDSSKYSLVDVDDLAGISSEQYCFQVLDEIASARQAYAHDIEAYGDGDVGRHDSISNDEAARYGLEICQQLS
jgi:hypothetical protein